MPLARLDGAQHHEIGARGVDPRRQLPWCGQLHAQMRHHARGQRTPVPHPRLGPGAGIGGIVDHQVGMGAHTLQLGAEGLRRAGALILRIIQRDHVVDQHRDAPGPAPMHATQGALSQIGVTHVQIGEPLG